MNLYAYVGNDPVNMIDSKGMFGQHIERAFYGNVQPLRTEFLLQSAAGEVAFKNAMDNLPIAVAGLNAISFTADMVAVTAMLFGQIEVAAPAKAIGSAAGMEAAAGEAILSKQSIAKALAIEGAGSLIGGKIVGTIGTVATGLARDERKNIVQGAAQTADVIASKSISDSLKSASNSESGMSGSVYKVCSGMGAQADGCR